MKASACTGLAPSPRLGASVVSITGFTVRFRAVMPLWISGRLAYRADGLIVSALGTRLVGASMENGRISRSATRPQRSIVNLRGAFFSKNLAAITARISHPAVMPIFRI